MNARVSGRKASAVKSPKHSVEGNGAPKGSSNAKHTSPHMSLGIMDEATIAQGAMRALEPRILLDAAMDATMEAIGDINEPLTDADRAQAGHQAETNEKLLLALADLDSANAGTAPPSTEIVFVNADVENSDELIEGFGPNVEIVMLSAETDGVEQMAVALEGRKDIDAIHIISHGRSGTLDLGSTKLTEASMNTRHADEMAVIRAALSDDADILIYGCDFGANARGLSAVQALADLTGADVAASEDLTGAANLGGDWDLEVETGSIETVGLESGTYAHTLAAPTVSANTLTLNYVAYDRTDSTPLQFIAGGFTGDTDGDAIQSIRMAVATPIASDGANETITFGDFTTKTIALSTTADSGTFMEGGREYTVTWTPTSDGNGEFLISRTDGSGMVNPQTGNILTGMRYQNVSATNSAGGRHFYFYATDVTGEESGESQIPIVIATDGEPLATTDMSTLSAEDLANALVGDGIQIVPGSVTYFGEDTQAGTFTNGTTAAPGVIGFDDGLIFSTGSIDNFAQANRGDSTTGIAAPFGTTDADFTALGGSISRDPTYLEFSFIPDSDTITLQYIFGSDEYDEFVGSNFNDNFAIFVNGQNVAVLPDGEALTVNTVNAGQNQSLFVDNELYNENVPGVEASHYLTEADGFTRTLSAITRVIPNQVNTIKIGIADIGDQARDSWAVVRADSFSSNPVANTDLFYSAPAVPVTIDLTDNDTDPEDDPLEVTELNGVPWSDGSSFTLASGVTLTMNGTGAGNQTVTATPPAGNTVDITDAVSYQITDPGGNKAVGIANIIFSTVPPVDAVDDGYTMPDPTQQFTTPSVILNDSDPGETPAVNAPTLSVSSLIATGTQGTVVDNGDGTFTYTPPAGGLIGTDSFDYIITDGQTSDRATVTIIGTIVDSPPIIDLNSAASDADTVRDNTVTFTEGAGPVDVATGTAGTFDTDGDDLQALFITPSGLVDGTDETVLIAGQTFINGTPSNANGVSIAGISVNITYDGTQFVVREAADNPITTAQMNIIIRSVQYENLSDTPNETSVRELNFQIQQEDGTPPVPVLSNVATASINVAAVNFAPSITGPTTLSVDEDGSVLVGIEIFDTDSPNVTMTLSVDPSHGTLSVNNSFASVVQSGNNSDTVVLNGSPSDIRDALATLTFEPVADFNTSISGTIPLTVTATDGADAATPFVTNITINPISDTAADTLSTNDATPLTFNVLTGSNGAAVDNFEGSPQVTSITQPASGSATLDNADGTITFTPTIGFTGSTSFSYTVTSGGVIETGTVTINIGQSNRPPVAEDDQLSATENGSDLAGSVITPNGTTPGLVGDLDPDGDMLMVTQVNGLAANLGAAIAGTAGGVFTINNNGSYSFSDNGDFEDLAVGEQATTAVTYTIADGNGGTDTATVTVTVTGTNDGPMVVSGSEIPDQIGVDAELITPIDVTGAFVDADTNDTLSYTATGLPAGLALNATTGLIEGTLDASASQNGNTGTPTDGVYSIDVTADDGQGGTVTDTFLYTVTNPAPNATNDAQTVSENGPVSTFNVITDNNGGAGADSDPDGDAPLTVSQVNGDPALVGTTVAGTNGGTFTINADGSTSFDPGADFNGLAVGEQATTTIEYQIRDGEGGVDTAVVTMTVEGANDAPVIIDPNNPPPDPANPTPLPDPNIIPQQSINDGAGFTTTPLIDVSDYIQDPDQSDGPTYSTTDPLPAGLTLNADGTITGVVDNSASQGGPNNDGVYPISVAVSDSNGGTVDIALTIDVSNLPPVAVDDVSSGTEDVVQTGNLITDPVTGDADTPTDSDPLIITEIEGTPVVAGTPTDIVLTNGTLSVEQNGAWTFSPNGNANVLDVGDSLQEVVTYQLSDSEGGTFEATLTITINGLNDPVQVVDPDDPATDPQDPLYEPHNPASIPDPDNLIADVTAVDGATPPSIQAGDYFGDAENDVLVFSATDLPAGLTIDAATGEISGTIDNSASQSGNTSPGVYDVVVTATDLQGNTAQTTITYTITNPAVVAQDDDLFGSESAVLTGSVYDDNGNGVDMDTPPDSDDLTVNLVNGNAANVGQATPGTNGGQFTINPDGSYSFDPGNDFQNLATGTVVTTSVTYQITDGEGSTSQATVTVTVDGTNDAPIPVDPSQPILPNPNDPSAPPSDPSDPRLPPDDPLNYIPVQNATDGQTNLPPLDLNQYFGDPDAGDALALSLDVNDLPEGLTFDPATGIISGAPSGNASQGGDPLNPGTYVISVTATDPEGLTFTTNVTYVISNLPPSAQNDDLTVDEDSSLTANVFDDNNNGVDADTQPDSDAIVVSEVDGAAGNIGQFVAGSNGGSFVISIDGALTFDPGTNFQDLDDTESRTTTVTYQISDGQGGTSDATVTVTVTGVNDGPVVIDPADPGDPKDPNVPTNPNNLIDEQTAADGQDLTPLDISGYFTDVDDEPLTYTLGPGAPAWVAIDPNTGIITGTPPPDGSQGGPANDGIYPIIVTATDPEGESASTSFDLVIENVPPVAVDDAAAGTEDVVQTGNVITDATTGDSDGGNDADPLTVTMVQGQPVVPGTPTIINLTSGALEMRDDGTWSFTPNGNANVLDAGEMLTETITYQIDDGQGGTDTAELTITIEGMNDPVVLVDPDNPETDPTDPRYSPDDPQTPDDPTTLVPPLTGGDDLSFPPFDVTPYFGDAEGDVLTYTATGLPDGLAIDPQTGIISGRPANDASVDGPYSVTIIATDPDGNTAELPLTIEIENQPPVLDIEVPDHTVYPGQPLTVALPTYFSDPDKDGLTYSATGIPSGLTLDPQTGLITGSADPQTVTGGPNGDGIFVVTVTADDGQGGTVTDIFEIKVLPQSFVAPPAADGPVSPELPAIGTGPGDPASFVPITDLVGDLGSLGPNTGIDNTMHPLDALIKQLGDTAPDTALDGVHYIDALVRHIDKLLARDTQSGGEFGAHGDQSQPYLGNDAQVEVALGRDTVVFRSLVWNGEVYVEILGAYGGKVFGDFRSYRVTGPDGGALPSWINQRTSNLVMIDRPANVEAIAIEVQITLRDGSVTVVPMVIDLLTGDIDVSQSATADAQISGTFSDRVTAMADAPLEKQNALFAALKNHTV